MKYVFAFSFLILLQQAFAQDSDTVAVFALKVRKPAGKVTTTGEYPSPRNSGRNAFADSTAVDTLAGYPLDIVYPGSASELGISGVVYISYQYDRKGKTKNIFLEKGVHAALDSVAMDYVRNMAEDEAKKTRRATVQAPGPPGQPGAVGFDIVVPGAVRYTIPIRFSLK